MGSDFTPILLLIALLAVFYIVVIRPARRQQQATATIQRNLEVGDDVVLSSGVFGTIAGLEEAQVRLEVAPGVVITVARQVVVRRVAEESDSTDPVQPAAAAPDEHPTAHPAGDQTEDKD